MIRRGKILAIAYACDPYRGSEEGVGWGWVNMIAAQYDVVCVTALGNRDSIERYHKESGIPSAVAFHYIEHTWSRAMTRLWSLAWTTYFIWTYRKWQGKAYGLARRLDQEHHFDLCHLITYVGFRSPGQFYRLDCPFVWGPIGGLENTPWKALPALDIDGMAYYGLRNLINTWQKNRSRRPRQAFKKAAGLIAATRGIQEEIEQYYHRESQVICEIGTAAVDPGAHSIRRAGEALQISWSGNHLPGKALHLLLEALARLPESIKWRLHILGDGPASGKWQKLARRRGLEARCIWHGRVARGEAIKVVRDSHLFITTSLKDLTSTVLLEALTQGVPVVAFDHCGFADLLTRECGLKVAVSSPGTMVGELAGAIGALYADEKTRQKLAKGAIERSQGYLWSRKIEQVQAVYRTAFEHG